MKNKKNYQTITDTEKFLQEYDFAKNAVEVPKEIDVDTSRDSKDTKEVSLGLPRNNSTPKTDKSQVKQKLEYLNHFANKQYELWGTTLHNAFFDYYDKLDKGVMPRNRDIKTYRISLITAKYDIFCKVFNKATLPYDELKSLKKIISKGQNIDFNDRNLSLYINSFERPYEFVLEHAGSIKDKELKIEICKELAKILSEIEQKSQQNIEELKKICNQQSQQQNLSARERLNAMPKPRVAKSHTNTHSEISSVRVRDMQTKPKQRKQR